MISFISSEISLKQSQSKLKTFGNFLHCLAIANNIINKFMYY